jgi:hypothetical protein
MDDEGLDRALQSLKRRTVASLPEREPGEPECLPFARARLLALNPAFETRAERLHLTTCRACRRLVERFAEAVPHLPFWTLLRRRAGALSPEERRVVEYHLDAAGCQLCAARAAQLETTVAAVLELPCAIVVTPREVVRAAVPGPTVLLRGGDAELEADLVRDRDELSLEIRTRQSRLAHSLVAYRFEDREGTELLSGFALLAPDVEGWFAAETALDAAELNGDFSRCEALLVSPVNPLALSGDDWRQVLAIAPPVGTDPALRPAWVTFISATLARPDSLPDPVVASLRAWLAAPGAGEGA